MDDKVFAVVKPDNQVLAAALKFTNRPARNSALKSPRARKTNYVSTPHARPDNLPADQ